jgi:serine/threonine-protein kinase
MYECLTQRTPQQGLAMYDLLRAVAEGRCPSLAELRPDLPPPLVAIIARAMRLRPQERFASVYELGQALFPFAGPESQRPFDDYYRGAPEPARRTPPRREAAVSPAATLREPVAPVPTWQGRATRTSSRRRRVHHPPEGARASSGSRVVAYSVAIGAVVAAVVLGALLLALRA